MLLKKLAVSVAGVTLSTLTMADAPQVVTDIAPVHSLVSQVMKGVGKPILLISPENSPHEYNLRPSEARALSKADVVFWIGEDLTPWLHKSLDNLAESAHKVSLLETDGITLHEFREGATFEAHDHDEEHDDHDDHDHDDHDHDDHDHDEHEDHDHDEHDDHDHDEHEDHDHDEHDDHDHDEHDDHDHDEHEDHDHDEHDDHGHDDHEGHSHEGHDPHVWLDPVNAQVWVKEIAATLSEEDPENASAYQANADAAIADLEDLVSSLRKEAENLEGVKFIVFHDAYQYFEQRFDVLATGAVSVSDAADPSPARVAEIRDTVADLNVSCVYTEPQFSSNIVNAVFRGTEVHTGVMDPMGVNIKTGATHYGELISNLMKSLSDCKN